MLPEPAGEKVRRMNLLDKLPPEVEEKTRFHLPDGAEILLALPAGMGPDGRFAETWLVATRDHLFVFPPDPLSLKELNRLVGLPTL